MIQPRQIPQEDRLNKKQLVAVIFMNAMLLVELTVSVYLGQQDPENLVSIFLKTFLPLCIATLVAARIIVRRLQGIVPDRTE